MAAGSLERTFDFGAGPAASVAVSWGDLATGYNTTGIANIDTYFEATPSVRTVVAANRFLGPLLGAPPTQVTLEQMTNWLPRVRTQWSAAFGKPLLLRKPNILTAASRERDCEPPSVYAFRGDRCGDQHAEVATGNYEPGFQTPAGLFGADFILGFDGVTRDDAVIEATPADSMRTCR